MELKMQKWTMENTHILVQERAGLTIIRVPLKKFSHIV